MNDEWSGNARAGLWEEKSYSCYSECLFADYSTKLFLQTSNMEPFPVLPLTWNVYLLLTTFYCVESTLRNEQQSDLWSCWERHKLAKKYFVLLIKIFHVPEIFPGTLLSLAPSSMSHEFERARESGDCFVFTECERRNPFVDDDEIKKNCNSLGTSGSQLQSIKAGRST